MLAAERWASGSSSKWGCNHYKWPYNWVTGVIILLIGVITPFKTGRGPSCRISSSFCFFLHVFLFICLDRFTLYFSCWFGSYKHINEVNKYSKVTAWYPTKKIRLHQKSHPKSINWTTLGKSRHIHVALLATDWGNQALPTCWPALLWYSSSASAPGDTHPSHVSHNLLLKHE